MELSEIKEIIELFSKCNVDKLDLEQEGLNLKLAKKARKIIAVQEETPAGTPPPLSPVVAKPVDEDAGLAYVTSPIVGTFYRAPNPTAEPFVKVGDHVSQGQTLCIVEAMKLMNEIQAEQDGEIVKRLVENGEGVEFGQRLFAIRPS